MGQERQGRYNVWKNFDDLLYDRRHGSGRQPQELANFEKVEVRRQCPRAGASCKKAESVIDLKHLKSDYMPTRGRSEDGTKPCAGMAHRWFWDPAT